MISLASCAPPPAACTIASGRVLGEPGRFADGCRHLAAPQRLAWFRSRPSGPIVDAGKNISADSSAPDSLFSRNGSRALAAFLVLVLQEVPWPSFPQAWKPCDDRLIESVRVLPQDQNHALVRETISFGPLFHCSAHLRTLFFALLVILGPAYALAQGGPPYYTNDPGTPGHLNWEINLGYMPFFYQGQSVSHVPDLDINFGVGERIQLTYENAWLRVQNPSTKTQYGLGQSNPGVKWRFYDAGEGGLSVSIFPQLFLNNPNDAVRRGITPASETFLLPVEFSKKLGPVDVDLEVGYQFVHKAHDGWITGLVVGHDVTAKLEVDAEFYSQGPFHLPDAQPTFDFGGRYKIHSPVILLFMAGRSFETASNKQPYFVGYFGLQFLLPPKSYNRE
jgi:hypothetical protein